MDSPAYIHIYIYIYINLYFTHIYIYTYIGVWEGLITSDELLDDANIAVKPAHLFMYEQSAMRSLSEPKIREQAIMTPSNEDYYPRVAVTALMRILRDPSQSVHHSSVTEAIMLIFKSLGMQCVPFLDQIVPYLLQLIRRCNPGLRESLLQQLSQLASIVQYHLVPYLGLLSSRLKTESKLPAVRSCSPSPRP